MNIKITFKKLLVFSTLNKCFIQSKTVDCTTYHLCLSIIHRYLKGNTSVKDLLSFANDSLPALLSMWMHNACRVIPMACVKNISGNEDNSFFSENKVQGFRFHQKVLDLEDQLINFFEKFQFLSNLISKYVNCM